MFVVLATCVLPSVEVDNNGFNNDGDDSKVGGDKPMDVIKSGFNVVVKFDTSIEDLARSDWNDSTASAAGTSRGISNSIVFFLH